MLEGQTRLKRDICRVFSLDRVRLPLLIKSIVHSFLVLILNDSRRRHYLKGSRETWKSCARMSPVEAILRKNKLILRNLQVHCTQYKYSGTSIMMEYSEYRRQVPEFSLCCVLLDTRVILVGKRMQLLTNMLNLYIIIQ